MPSSKKRRKARERQARETQTAQRRAEKKRLTPGQYTMRRALGWGLVALAIIVGVSHWLAHLGVLYEDRGLWDVTIGYPMAGVLGVAGAIVLSKVCGKVGDRERPTEVSATGTGPRPSLALSLGDAVLRFAFPALFSDPPLLSELPTTAAPRTGPQVASKAPKRFGGIGAPDSRPNRQYPMEGKKLRIGPQPERYYAP